MQYSLVVTAVQRTASRCKFLPVTAASVSVSHCVRVSTAYTSSPMNDCKIYGKTQKLAKSDRKSPLNQSSFSAKLYKALPTRQRRHNHSSRNFTIFVFP